MVKLLFDTVVIDPCCCIFVQTHRVYHTRSEPCGFSGGSDGKNLPAVQETQVQPQVRKILWRREWQPTPIFLPGEFHGQRSLKGYSLGATKSQTRLSD